MKALGIDYGTKKVGIAISDDTGALAFPREVVKNNKTLVELIGTLCQREDVDVVVLGESKNFAGKPNVIMEELDLFRSRLENIISVPIVLEEEFLTTSAARNSGTDENMIDAHAAALILQRYLDRKKKHESR